MERRGAAGEADGQADAGGAEAAVEAGADAERAGFLDLPVVAGEGVGDGLLPAVGVEGPGVGGVAAELEAEMVDELGAGEGRRRRGRRCAARR